MTARIPLRFGDFDANRHVNNVAYFALMEAARVQFLLRLRAEYRLSRTLIAHADVDYLREVRIDTEYVDIDMSVTRIGTSSVTLLHEIRDAMGIAARGHAVLVAVDKEGRKRPFATEEREALSLHMPGRSGDHARRDGMSAEQGAPGN